MDHYTHTLACSVKRRYQTLRVSNHPSLNEGLEQIVICFQNSVVP